MLKQFNLSKNYAEKAVLAFMICALFSGLSCGKRKPPLPPVERVSQRVVISGTQRGNIVTLVWTLPAINASDSSILNIARADIYRLAEPLTAPLTLSEEEFASRSTLISTVPISEIDFAKKQLSYTDILGFTGQPARLRYAVRLVNSSGQKAAFSNFLLVEPTAKVAESPTALTAKVSEPAIILNWNAPIENVDGTKPANILGFNIYRRENRENRENENVKLLNNTPVTDDKFNDEFFDFGKEYGYFVRTVSLGNDGEPIESLNSNVVEVKPKDTFAPSPPSAITIAAAPKNLSIFFAVNPEKDISGYKVYRSTNPNQPKAEWMLLTNEPLARNTFQDINVESGNTYYYYLTAVDTAGNVSEPSETISETAP